MEQIRKPFQGILNIIKFNWHFYLLSGLFLIALLILNNYLSIHFYVLLLFYLTLTITAVSLLVSFYIYDLSNLYKLYWLADSNEKIKIVNISAGFDETSELLQSKFKNADLIILDFYNPKTHTEISIKRARKAYSSFPNTKEITTSNLTLSDNSIDRVFVTFSAHEIRNKAEQVVFFNELKRVIKPNGQIYVTEHLRDLPNFLAYNIGFFHFLSDSYWQNIFEMAKLKITSRQKITPFITSFKLEKNGITT